MKPIKLKKGHVLVLRTNNKDNKSNEGTFQYPTKGVVEAPDWKPIQECGDGLHGAMMGCGDGELFNWRDDALWMVLSVEESSIIDLDGKVKFPKAEVVYVGDRKTATDIVASVYGHIGIIGATVTVGDKEMATAGDKGTATAGFEGTATAGDNGILNIKYHDDKNNRYRLAIAYVGEKGIEPNVPYKLNKNNEFIKVEE